MITKSKLRKIANIVALVFIVAVVVAGWVFANIGNAEKITGTLAVLAALRATLPGVKKEVEEAIDKSSLPESEQRK
jgi:hypothetical protein